MLFADKYDLTVVNSPASIGLLPLFEKLVDFSGFFTEPSIHSRCHEDYNAFAMVRPGRDVVQFA